MMRILNLETLFTKIEPELQRRITLSTGHSQRGSLTINTDVGTVTLDVAQGELALDFQRQAGAVLDLSQGKLSQMLAGYRRPRDVLNDPDVRATGDVLPWLDVLFPIGHPYMWHADHF